MESRGVEVEYSAIYQSTENFKGHKCIVPIKLGEQAYEGNKLIALLNRINSSFEECTVVICDTTQATDKGDAWLYRNESKINSNLIIPHTILRWNTWTNSSEYKTAYEKVERLLLAHPDLKALLDKAVERFDASLEYFKEQLAVSHLWYVYGYTFVVSIEDPQIPDELHMRLGTNLSYVSYKLKPIEAEQLMLRQILDSCPVQIHWKNKDGVYLGCNKAMLEHLGFTDHSQIIGKTDFDFMDPTFALEVRKRDLATIQEQRLFMSKEEDMKHKVFLHFRKPLTDEKGEVIGVICNSINITKQERMDREASERAKKFDVELKAKEEFLSKVSHQIKTPLQVIFSTAEGLYNNCATLSLTQIKNYSYGLLETKLMLINIINNLLALTRKNNQNKLHFDMTKASLVQIVKDVLDEVSYITHVEIKLDVQPNVSHLLYCDVSYMQQVIRNLLDNALKYGQGREVVIAIKRDGQDLECSVTDQGIGIPEDEKDLIFEPFQESSRTKSKAGTTGVGLAICHNVILAHKGKMWCKNNPEGGATFAFRLTAANVEEKV
jgi:PAS domain S-box-containing protein